MPPVPSLRSIFDSMDAALTLAQHLRPVARRQHDVQRCDRKRLKRIRRRKLQRRARQITRGVHRRRGVIADNAWRRYERTLYRVYGIATGRHRAS